MLLLETLRYVLVLCESAVQVGQFSSSNLVVIRQPSGSRQAVALLGSYPIVISLKDMLLTAQPFDTENISSLVFNVCLLFGFVR